MSFFTLTESPLLLLTLEPCFGVVVFASTNALEQEVEKEEEEVEPYALRS